MAFVASLYPNVDLNRHPIAHRPWAGQAFCNEEAISIG